jgi:hypothetical protein
MYPNLVKQFSVSEYFQKTRFVKTIEDIFVTFNRLNVFNFSKKLR